MNFGRFVFAQLMDYVLRYQFQACVDRYDGNDYVKSFLCWDQFLCMAFAQFNLPRKSARHRNLPTLDTDPALPPGFSRSGSS